MSSRALFTWFQLQNAKIFGTWRAEPYFMIAYLTFDPHKDAVVSYLWTPKGILVFWGASQSHIHDFTLLDFMLPKRIRHSWCLIIFNLKKPKTKTHKVELCWRCRPRNLSFICSAFGDSCFLFFVPALCNPTRHFHIEISWILQQSNTPLNPPPPERNAARLRRALLQSCDTVSEPSNSLQSQRDLKEGNGALFKSDVHILSASPHLTNVDSQESPARKRLHGQKDISRLQWQTTTPSSPPKQIQITINLSISACSFRLRDLFRFFQSSKFCDWHTYLVLSGFFSLKVWWTSSHHDCEVTRTLTCVLMYRFWVRDGVVSFTVFTVPPL